MPSNSRIPRFTAAALAAGLLALVGCGEGERSSDTPAGSSNGSAAHALPDGLFLTAVPDGVESIKALKRSAEEGDAVVVRAVVGGRVNPIVEGRASATIVDVAQPNTCLADDDHCRTPWDYCCEPGEELKANLATLQVVDDDGRVLAADLSRRIDPLSTLVVRGVVGPRPTPDVLTINATGIYVEPGEQD